MAANDPRREQESRPNFTNGWYSAETVAAGHLAKLTAIEMLDEVARRFRDAGEKDACNAVESLAANERTRKVRER